MANKVFVACCVAFCLSVAMLNYDDCGWKGYADCPVVERVLVDGVDCYSRISCEPVPSYKLMTGLSETTGTCEVIKSLEVCVDQEGTDGTPRFHGDMTPWVQPALFFGFGALASLIPICRPGRRECGVV
jgi:hypothetical protein